MLSSDIAAAARPLYRVFRALAFTALLASHWIDATAAPTLSGSPATTVTAAHYYSFQPSVSNPGGGTLTFSVANKPSWAYFDTSSGRLYGTPVPQTNVGTFANIEISASGTSGTGRLGPFSVTVLALPKTPPVLSGSPATSVVAGKPYSFQLSAVDPNGLRMDFVITDKPSWASFNTTTGLLSGTPTASNVGTYSNIVITAYDGYTKGVLPAFNIVVQSSGSTTTPPPTTPPPTTTASSGSDNFPRLGLLSTAGSQMYGSSFQTFAAKVHMVVIAGSWEGWERGVGYSKEKVISSIKGQSNVNTRVFQYVDLNELYNSTYASDSGFPTWDKQVTARAWWLYPVGTEGTPVVDPQSSQKWLVNMGPNVPVDPSTGLGPYAWGANYLNNLFHLGRISGTSGAASLDGFFLDNILIDPSNGGGNAANGDWLRNGTTQAHNAATTYSAVMAGEKSFYTYLESVWPGSIQLGNAGGSFAAAVGNAYGTDATLNSQILAGTSTLSGVIQGGDFEHAIGRSYSVEYWGGSLELQQYYRTAINNYGGSKMMLFSQGNVQANGSDPLTFSSGVPATYSPAWQGARYGITAALMNNGYYFADSGVYDEETVANRRWFDEYDNAGAGVGYLGQPVAGSAGAVQTAAWSNGVWMREFKNGVVLWNPKRNGARTVSVAGLVSPSGHAGLKHINGTQDRAVNNGLAVTSVTLNDRDGVILLWTSP
jgi:Putative Ig domain